ncbi:hypothetical protein [Pseudalkalibacillus hwajinpoensis]|uniref:hypothetical protein n=1 Tax=Guptibacillus hwajinpoensis TaxID=208199 RepID=UPI001CFCF812|nr:hypothetical protein [Pseudalkalibacillus hwajinpoensis]
MAQEKFEAIATKRIYLKTDEVLDQPAGKQFIEAVAKGQTLFYVGDNIFLTKKQVETLEECFSISDVKKIQ